jgi:hypothetical protein
LAQNPKDLGESEEDMDDEMEEQMIFKRLFSFFVPKLKGVLTVLSGVPF